MMILIMKLITINFLIKINLTALCFGAVFFFCTFIQEFSLKG